MRLLLDTHIWLWSTLEPARLGKQITAELRNRENELWLSPISTWEAMVLAEKRRLELAPDPASWIRQNLERVAFREAALTHEVALQMGKLNLPHRDPADRILVATALVYELKLVTADQRLLRCRGLPLLPNR